MSHLIAPLSWEAKLPLSHHLVALCLLLALDASDAVIFELLPGMTPGQLAMLRANKIITGKQAEFKDKFLGENASEQFQRYMPKVFEIFADVLNSSEMKLEKRLEAAKWMAEKVTGKAKQEMELSGGTTILHLLQELARRDETYCAACAEAGRISGGFSPHAAIDVTPKPKDALAEWVSLNFPGDT